MAWPQLCRASGSHGRLTALPLTDATIMTESIQLERPLMSSGRRPWFLSLARRYVRRRLARNFDGVFVRGLDRARMLCAAHPVVIAPNHVAWWDAFLVVLLDQALQTEGYCLMDSASLRRLPFFRWLGAVELDRSNPRRSLRDLSASLSLLDRPGRALWIFPQGDQRPSHLRPLGLQKGVALLAQKSRVPVLPLSISYLYSKAPRPRIVVTFGTPLVEPMRRTHFMNALESRLVEGLDANDRFLLAGDAEFEPLLSSARDSSDTPAGARLLAAFGGGLGASAQEERRSHAQDDRDPRAGATGALSTGGGP